MIDMSTRNHQFWTSWSCLLRVVAAIVASLIALYWKYEGQETRFENLAVEQSRFNQFANVGGGQVHCTLPFGNPACAPPSDNKTTVLWLGASHLHVIMAYQQGQKGGVARVAEALEDKDVSFTVVSAGNSPVYEFYAVYEYLRKRIHPKIVIIGMVVDDMREEVSYAKLEDILKDDVARKNLSKTRIGAKLVERFAEVPNSQKGGALEKVEDVNENDETAPVEPTIKKSVEDNSNLTIKAIVENKITDYLAEHFELWRVRKEARGNFHVSLMRMREYLGDFRRWVLGQPSNWWMVSFPKALWTSNWQAFEAILNVAEEEGAKALIYIAPRPADSHFPYEPRLYEEFKKSVERETKKHGGVYINLENAVDSVYFGGDRSTRDLFHFSEEGHKQFSQKIIQSVGEIIEGLPK